jgi:hypothetical protein
MPLHAPPVPVDDVLELLVVVPLVVVELVCAPPAPPVEPLVEPLVVVPTLSELDEAPGWP